MEHVIAATTLNPVGESIAGQDVVVRRADNVLDISVLVALGMAMPALSGGQVHGHAGVRAGIGHGVRSRTAVNNMSADSLTG